MRLLPTPRTVDDAFITFRYSHHLVEGSGFVYNPAERVLGTTTPLYTLLMALWGGLFGDNYPWYALLTNAFADGVSVVLLFLILRHLTGLWQMGLWGAGLWVMAPFSVTFAIGGMETSIHNVLMVGAFWVYLQDATPRQQWFLGILCALGVLTRPDALLWATPLLLDQLLRPLWADRRLVIPWRTWLSGLAFFLPWVIFAAWYFGNPIPQSVSSKAAVYHLPEFQALTVLLQHYATPFQDHTFLGRYGIILGIFLYPTLALIGTRAVTVQFPRALPMLIYPWLYLLVFAVANPLMFRWYLVPPLPAYFVAILCGVAALLKLSPKPQRTPYIVSGLAGLTLIFTLGAWELHPPHGADRPAPQMAFHELELHYAEMADRLRQNYGLTDDNTLAAGDIGAIGFYSHARIFDTIGLVTTNTTQYYEDVAYLESIRADEMNYAIPPDLILDRQPDFIVVMEGFIREGLAQDPRFIEQYELIEFIPTDYYGTGMQAFRRRAD